MMLEFQELVEGKIIVKSSSSISHYGIRIAVNGSVNLQVPISPFDIMIRTFLETFINRVLTSEVLRISGVVY